MSEQVQSTDQVWTPEKKGADQEAARASELAKRAEDAEQRADKLARELRVLTQVFHEGNPAIQCAVERFTEIPSIAYCKSRVLWC